jgi:uncharacterized protein YkwD
MKLVNRRLMIVLAAGGLAGSCIGRSLASERYADFARRMIEAPPAGSQFRSDLEARLVRLANSYRAKQGRSALADSDLLRAAARAHAADMMLNDFVGHRSSTGHGFESRVRSFLKQPELYPALAENAARDTQKGPADAAAADRVFGQWVKSGGHRRTLTKRDYASVSTGVIARDGDIWAVQIFFSKPRQAGSGGVIFF